MARPIDMHIAGLEKMGATFKFSHGYLEAFADRDVLGPMRAVSERLEAVLIGLKRFPQVRHVRGERGGMVWGVEFADAGRVLFGQRHLDRAECTLRRGDLGLGQIDVLPGPLARGSSRQERGLRQVAVGDAVAADEHRGALGDIGTQAAGMVEVGVAGLRPEQVAQLPPAAGPRHSARAHAPGGRREV